MTADSPIFHTDRRIRLGIWGLGRGMSFYRTCAMLNFDVVAGCDYNAHMRERFLRDVPGAVAYADADEFLAGDFDAVLLATFCPAHAGDAMKCLAASKHVLSEVTAFHTLAEGVALVEAVERSGLVYNLAENYPFIAALDWLRRKWAEGLFGELQYAEFEYVHEIRSLGYTYIDGVPVQPGNTVHNWRSWMHFHYYCTHSLGPIMVITGERPTRVVSLPAFHQLPGYLDARGMGMGSIAPALINMSNGAVVRNLMGATTNDTHVQRIWGTKGSAEVNVGKWLQLRLGGSGSSPKLEVKPSWDALGEQAAQTGHGGGDFWVLYYFARQILTGEPAPFDVYAASDVTIPGILALRSATEGGKPFDVPDFRDPAQRDAHRHDDWAQTPYDVTAVFPPDADIAITGAFSATMANLIRCSLTYRAYADWTRVVDNMTDPERVLAMLENLQAMLPELRETYAAARRIIDAYPASDGAKVLRQMLDDVGDEARVMAPGFADELDAEAAALRERVAALTAANQPA
ncbi:MAG: Alpha-N-acetylgalactosaminidase [bacterium ADurb.Bin429]|nr:MAG: Alpha-N-acetylgalactosaminidase [bacterium ADurb.Bin429]